MKDTTNKPLTRDEQILFARDIELHLRGVRAILKRVTADIDAIFSSAIDGDIRSDLGIAFDGAEHAYQNITDTLHDACLDNHQTSDELFLAELGKQHNIDYRDNKVFFANWGKL